MTKKKKICVCGSFGFGKEFLDGQTIKTKNLTEELKKAYGKAEVNTIDTHGGIKRLPNILISVAMEMKRSKNFIILPARNGLKILVPYCIFLRKVLGGTIHYVVIGGWLPEYIRNKKVLSYFLKKIDHIFIETPSMKNLLDQQGFQNVEVMPNFKRLNILSKSELVYSNNAPFRVCTFSRVAKTKGIEEAVSSVKQVNKMAGRIIMTLDIFGQVDANQQEWFFNLCKLFPPYIHYKGIIPYKYTTEVLKNYFVLLFPTYYEGEGFPGTLLDALAAGIPVIASDWKYNKEIVIQGKTGVIIADLNGEKLANQLIGMIKNSQNWNRNKEIILEVARKYTPEVVTRCIKKYIC